MVTVAGWTPIEEWWVGSLGSSLTDSDLTSGKSGCSDLTESRSMGMAWMRSSVEGRGRAKKRLRKSRIQPSKITMVVALTFSSEL